MTGSHRLRLWWVVLAFAGGVATAMAAEELILRARGPRLEFTAPRLHYLTGRPLARLHNAEPVVFEIQVTLAAGTRLNIVKRSTARFVISYDLWEEKFKVTKTLPALKTANHLTANEVEAWCVQEMAMTDLAELASDQPLWARMEIRAEERDRRLFGRDNITDDGISLTSLIEKFSRLPQTAQLRWILEEGPVTLAQLRRGG